MCVRRSRIQKREQKWDAFDFEVVEDRRGGWKGERRTRQKNRTSRRGSHAARFERSTHPRVHYSLLSGAQAEQKPSSSTWSPPLPAARCLVRASSPCGKIRFIEPGVVVLKSNEKYFHYPGCLYCLAGTDLTNVLQTTVFPIHITIVCPPESPLDFIDIVGRVSHSVPWIVTRSAKDALAEKGAPRSSVMYDRSPWRLQPWGPPREHRGWYPRSRILHSVHSPLRSMHAADDI